MEDLETDERCDRCKKPISILVADFDRIMKDGDLILCPDCEIKAIDEQAEAEKSPKRCFEYIFLSIIEAPLESPKEQVRKLAALNELGQMGWEAFAVFKGEIIFKREYYEET